MNDKIQADIDTMLMIAKPKLDDAYRHGEGKLYHEISVEFIPVANRIFMRLYENADIKWFAYKRLDSKLCDPVFWKYTDLVQSFCDYLELRSKGVANASTA